jgi:hypothetical protein
MKNTPKVGLMSNFWGAVHSAGFFIKEAVMGAEIKMPVAKAVSAVSLATAAKVDAADALAKVATANASFETWFWVNSIPGAPSPPSWPRSTPRC